MIPALGTPATVRQRGKVIACRAFLVRHGAWALVARHLLSYGVTLGQMLAPTRDRRHCAARLHLYALLCDNLPDVSSVTLGDTLDRDHSTVLEGAKAHRQRAYLPLRVVALEALR